MYIQEYLLHDIQDNVEHCFTIGTLFCICLREWSRQDVCDLAEVRYRMVRDAFGRGECVGIAVEENRGKSGVMGSRDVRVEVIANHNRCGERGLRLAESEAEEIRVRFVYACVLAEDDVLEEIEQATGTQFAVLHFVKTVAANVHPITTLAQRLHDFPRAFHQSWLDGAAREEIIAHLHTIIHRCVQSLAQGERTSETLHHQVVTRNVALCILSPQVDVRHPVGVGKCL